MPKQYNTLRARMEALKEGRTLLTRKAARGVRSRGKRGKRLDEERAYKEGFVADGKRVVLEPLRTVVQAIVREPDPETPLEQAKRFAKTLMLSGIEPRVAIMRAAATHKVPPRELVTVIAGDVSGTNVRYGLAGVRD